MSKHAKGSTSAILYLRLRWAGTRMIVARLWAQKAEEHYHDLYVRRYGEPTIRVKLGEN
jgi:hypothetical protein